MQQVIDDKVAVSIPFLGGVNEQADVLNLPVEEFKSATGVSPEFTGMLARVPGKVAIRYETSPVRYIHQSFSGGSFCFYLQSDRLLLYNDCRNARYTVKPTPPDDLGTTDAGATLDVFGGAGYIPLGVPDLSFSPRCLPAGTAKTPDAEPGGGGGGGGGDGTGQYRVYVENFDDSYDSDSLPATVVVPGDRFKIYFLYQDGTWTSYGDITYEIAGPTFIQGTDFTGGIAGEFVDISDTILNHLTHLTVPLIALRFVKIDGVTEYRIGISAMFRIPSGCMDLRTIPTNAVVWAIHDRDVVSFEDVTAGAICFGQEDLVPDAWPDDYTPP